MKYQVYILKHVIIAVLLLLYFFATSFCVLCSCMPTAHEFTALTIDVSVLFRADATPALVEVCVQVIKLIIIMWLFMILKNFRYIHWLL